MTGLPGVCAGATVKTQVYDQLGTTGVWPHEGPVPVDGRCLLNSFLRGHGAERLVPVSRCATVVPA